MLRISKYLNETSTLIQFASRPNKQHRERDDIVFKEKAIFGGEFPSAGIKTS